MWFQIPKFTSYVFHVSMLFIIAVYNSLIPPVEPTVSRVTLSFVKYLFSMNLGRTSVIPSSSGAKNPPVYMYIY